MESPHLLLLFQARQGDAKAITVLLNKRLQSKGITAKCCVKNSCLHIMLEAAKTPSQKPLVDFLRKGLSGLAIDDWFAVKVYGRRTGKNIPDWVEEFKVRQELSQDIVTLAKQRDVKAITELINQKLQTHGVAAKVNIKNDCLQIMLEAKEIVNQDKIAALLKSEFQRLEVQDINSLRLYGKQYGEDFPDWQGDINLLSDEIESQKVWPNRLALSLPSEERALNDTLPAVQEADDVKLSNQLYIALQTTCYQHLTYKVNSENDKTIHEIVENFADGLELDLRRDLDQFAKQVINIAESFGIQLELAKIQAIVSDLIYADFAGVRLAIRDLERVTREVLQTEFTQETHALKAFFSGAAQEFTANLFGRTLMSQEAMIGTFIGTLIAPGFGSVIGGAIGGWLGGSRHEKTLEQLLERYQQSRWKVLREWEYLLQVFYGKISNILYDSTSLKLLLYQSLNQAIDFYNQGNEYLEKDVQKAIELYDKAIQANPGLVLALNNKGCALNRLEQFDEAISTLNKAIQIDPKIVIVLNNLGDSLQGLNRNKEAIKTYEESLRLDPKNYSAWRGIGVSLYALQEYEKVIEVADKLIDLDSENFLGWYVKASCQSRLGYTQQALENSKAALRLNTEAFQQLVKTDPDFDQLRKDERFQSLMESSVDMDYTTLRKYLTEKRWREADQETARLMKKIIQKVTNAMEINQGAINALPCVDLSTIDSLWKKHSDGRFGFSIQREIYQQSYQNIDLFGHKTGWRIKDADGNYSWRSNSSFDYNYATTPRGHLPSSFWAGEDTIWVENRRDRLIALFARMNNCSIEEA